MASVCTCNDDDDDEDEDDGDENKKEYEKETAKEEEPEMQNEDESRSGSESSPVAAWRRQVHQTWSALHGAGDSGRPYDRLVVRSVVEPARTIYDRENVFPSKPESTEDKKHNFSRNSSSIDFCRPDVITNTNSPRVASNRPSPSNPSSGSNSSLQYHLGLFSQRHVLPSSVAWRPMILSPNHHSLHIMRKMQKTTLVPPPSPNTTDFLTFTKADYSSHFACLPAAAAPSDGLWVLIRPAEAPPFSQDTGTLRRPKLVRPPAPVKSHPRTSRRQTKRAKMENTLIRLTFMTGK